MPDNDRENLPPLSVASVDAANREFYARFPYPGPPMTFPRLEDPLFETVMLNQSLGSYTHDNIPPEAKIWVAGCGTNQALYTALRFPKATVIGSDISPASLDLCLSNSKKLGVNNLTLREESLNCVTYDQQFDYVICTGVIHHNADPSVPLANIARALRPTGVLELMVYNYFHRILTTAFQKAVRMVSRFEGRRTSYDEELELAKAFIASEPITSRMAGFISSISAEAQIADAFIQPVEFSYTVESLNELITSCGLELLLPCFNQFDAISNRSWAMRFKSKAVQEQIDSLPDIARWQVVNLLLLEESPMLWFFLRRQGSDGDGRNYERQVNQSFLKQRFVPASTTLRNYVRGPSDLNYKLSSRPVAYPFETTEGLPSKVVKRSDASHTMGDTLYDLGVDLTDNKAINDIRIQTTTSLRPFLKAIEWA